MENRPERRKDASTKTCAECARLWKKYFEVDKQFLQTASEHLPLLSGGFDPRTEAEYQKAGELRRQARQAIDQHRTEAHPAAAVAQPRNKRLKALLEGGAL